MRRPKHQVMSNDEVLAVLRALVTQSDREAALVGAAFVEDRLGAAIKSRLVALPAKGDPSEVVTEAALFDGNGPLATFFAKIDIGFSLGLYASWRRNGLHIIRSVRNNFAHSMYEISFLDEEVSKKCSKLQENLTEEEQIFLATLNQPSTEAIRIKTIYVLSCAHAVGWLDQISKSPASPKQFFRPHPRNRAKH